MQVPVEEFRESVGWGGWHRDVMIFTAGGGPRGASRVEAVWKVVDVETVWQVVDGEISRVCKRDVKIQLVFLDDECYPINPEGNLDYCDWEVCEPWTFDFNQSVDADSAFLMDNRDIFSG